MGGEAGSRWRPVGTRRTVALGVGVVLLAAAVAVGVAGPWERREAARQGGARPAPGVPLRGQSGLRLLVAGEPVPFVLDLDTGATRPVTGLPGGDDRSVHLESVGRDAVVLSGRDCQGGGCDPDRVAYLVRHGGTVATRLGAAIDVELARDRAVQTLDVWLLDLATRRWRQLPDMPLRLAPAKPELRWTDDGRLLMLAGLADGPDSLVAVWRPGEPRVAVRQVRLPRPERSGYRFAVW
jgi:hypothetical protein